jgi:hypothetical protein
VKQWAKAARSLERLTDSASWRRLVAGGAMTGWFGPFFMTFHIHDLEMVKHHGFLTDFLGR